MSTPENQQLLYHYTNFNAFEKIIRSQVLRATHYWGSNDETEFVHASEPIREALTPIIEEAVNQQPDSQELHRKIQTYGSVHKFVQSEVKIIFDVAFNPKRQSGPQYGMMPPFVCCFCDHSNHDDYTRENGLLSMWRGYGSNGVALVFDRKELQACLDREGKEFGYFGCDRLLDVAYGSNDVVFQQQFGEFVDLLKCQAAKYLLHGHQFDETFLRLLTEAAAGYKHRAFKEEKEVRIALFPRPDPYVDYKKEKLKEIKSKDCDGRRYIELFSEIKEKLPIKKVIVGPQKDQRERVSMAKKNLKEYYPKIQVVQSQTPYKPG